MVPEAGVQGVGEAPCPGGLGGGGDPALTRLPRAVGGTAYFYAGVNNLISSSRNF